MGSLDKPVGMFVDGNRGTDLDHSAIPVRPGQIELAAKFMVGLGWTEITSRRMNWGESEVRFFQSNRGGAFIQLNQVEGVPHLPKFADGVHPAFAVADVRDVVDRIKAWAGAESLQFSEKDANDEGTKVFIRLPDVFACSIELVPRT